MHFAFVKQRYVSFAFRCGYAVAVANTHLLWYRSSTLCGQTDDIILSHGIQFPKHLVIIIAPVRDKGGYIE